MRTPLPEKANRRQRVAARSSNLLIGLACILPLAGQLRLGGLPIAVLLAAGLICAALSPSGEGRVSSVAGLLIFVPWLIVLTCMTWPREGVRRGKLTELVQSFGEPVEQTARWRAWDVAVRWIEEQEPAARARLDLSRAARSVRAALAPRDVPLAVSPYVLGQAADQGLIDGWLAEDAELGAAATKWAQSGAAISYPDQRRHTVRALELRGELAPGLRDELADRVLAAWDVDGEFVQLAGLAATVRFLELLDRSGRADVLAADARTMLERSYLRDVGEHPWLGVGGDAFRGRANRAQSVYPDLGASLAALELMQRFGVPPALDLRALRRHLRGKAHRFGLREPGLFAARGGLALAQLEERFPEAAGLEDPWRPSERDVALIAALLLGAGLIGWTAWTRPT